MKKIDVNQILNQGAILLKRGELMDIIGGSDPDIGNGACLGVECASNEDCKDPVCPRCDPDPLGGLCAT